LKGWGLTLARYLTMGSGAYVTDTYHRQRRREALDQ
jgi:hypothetical protein